MDKHYSISSVEYETGIPKDLLRMWERRYGFPRPGRDHNGDRVYTDEEVRKLRYIRILVERGLRPGKLVAIDLATLADMVGQAALPTSLDDLLHLLRASDPIAVRAWLQRRLQAQGLRLFVTDTVSRASAAVAAAWAGEVVSAHEEHFYVEIVTNFLRLAMQDIDGGSGRPKVMLTTVPGEQHVLDLLLMEAILRLDGCNVIPFGVEMPYQSIIAAAIAHQVDVVGLSFGDGFQEADAVVSLWGLRQMLPPAMKVWASAEVLKSRLVVPDGVKIIPSFAALSDSVMSWRHTHAPVQDEA